jgi:hypothetical protein
MIAEALKKKYAGSYDASKSVATSKAKRHGISEFPFHQSKKGLIASVLAEKRDGKIATKVTQAMKK